MGFIRLSHFKKLRVKRFFKPFDHQAVVKKVPFGDKLVDVTTYELCDVKHPIPPEIKTSMFSVSNSPNAQLVKQPLFFANQTEEIFSGYLRLLDSMNNMRAERAANLAASSIVEPIENE